MSAQRPGDLSPRHQLCRLGVAAVAALSLTACGAQPAAKPVPPGLLDGEQLFELRAVSTEPGCVTCHTRTGDQVLVGPPLAGIATKAGDRVPDLDAGAYLNQSIIDPGAHRVPGFEGEDMPTVFADAFSDEQIDALVAYLLELE